MIIDLGSLNKVLEQDRSDKIIYVIGSKTRGLGEAEELKKLYPTEKFEFLGDYDFLPFGLEDIRTLSSAALEKLDMIANSDPKCLIIASERVSSTFGYKIFYYLENVPVVLPETVALKDAPIVIIDSGLGGLEITRDLVKQKPAENFIFISDNEFMPYGTKDQRIVSRRIIRIIAYVKKLKPKAVVLACNTLDAIAGDKIDAQLGGIRLIRIIHPTALRAVKESSNKQIGLLATINTVDSQRYMLEMLGIAKDTHLYGLECQNMASAIEKNENIKQVTKEEIAPLKDYAIDTLILGCTHYHKAIPVIKKEFPNVNIVDSSEVLVAETVNILENQLPYNIASKGSLTIFSTKIDDVLQNNLDMNLIDIEYNLEGLEIK